MIKSFIRYDQAIKGDLDQYHTLSHTHNNLHPNHVTRVYNVLSHLPHQTVHLDFLNILHTTCLGRHVSWYTCNTQWRHLNFEPSYFTNTGSVVSPITFAVGQAVVKPKVLNHSTVSRKMSKLEQYPWKSYILLDHSQETSIILLSCILFQQCHVWTLLGV